MMEEEKYKVFTEQMIIMLLNYMVLHSKTADSLTIPITEVDPIFTSSVASGISTTDTTNWNNKLDTDVDVIYHKGDPNTGCTIIPFADFMYSS